MRWIAAGLAGLILAALATASGGFRLVSAHGIGIRAPAGWHRLDPTPSSITDPRTFLVVGTKGVSWDLTSACQIEAYRIPVDGAVVVVLGWRSVRSAHAAGMPAGRAPLMKLVRVSRTFECDPLRRGAAADVLIGRKVYQVNVLVGDRASVLRVSEALAVARSFDLSR